MNTRLEEVLQPSWLGYLAEPFAGWRGWVVPLGLSLLLVLISQTNFVLFHTLAELFAIMVAIILSVVAWHTYSFSRNHYLMYLGVGYFWIAILDLLHTLSFPGVSVIPAPDAGMTIEFWIVTRYFEALLLLSGPLFFTRRVQPVPLLLLFGLIAWLLASWVFSGVIPDAYVEGEGLTRFKVLSEYVVILLLMASAGLLTWYRGHMDRDIYFLMIGAILLTVAAELTFTLYHSVYSTPLLIGHILKLLSFWLIYYAVIRTTLTAPYRVLARGSSTYDAIPDPTLLVDADGIIRQVNRAAATRAGREPEAVVGRHCHDLFHSAQYSQAECVICQHVHSSQPLSSYEQYLSETGEWREYSLAPFGLVDGFRGMVHVATDITARKRAEEQLIRQANYDQLTHLPNRALAMDRLQVGLSRAAHNHTQVAAMFIDLDNFKNINDSLGHRVGDKLLVEAAGRFQATLEAGETLARWGGDEFLVLLPELQGLERAEAVAEQILQAMSRPVQIEQRELIVSASIGIAVYPDDGQDPDVLLSDADTAMYRAKAAGRNTYRFFTPEMNRDAALRLELETELRHAVERGELYMVYQPQVDLETRQVIGCEALMRWSSRRFGEVPPDRFIPLAEESGLINPIGEWMLNRVFADISALNRTLGRHLAVSINISSRQLREPSFLERFRHYLDEYALAPDGLLIEITESLLVEDDEATMGCLDALVRMGMRLSMDDFGTGYSSLSYLKRFPFSEIKIDRDFVRDISTDPGDAALCLAIIAMAKGLGIQVVGEGVETEAQADFLSEHEADIGQGYLFSRPLRLEDLCGYLGVGVRSEE
ncbi:multisensor diguanylate cyclase/phophodiesterase [Thiohalobacter thiocyanaticus]|uniref:Multisensor diguanylate cyclase/phophodiesterase n=1 Tax=Thiohalobacter thiocyanaticus TaxID=585455 RepID=A0A1Z4VV42_9GAMM|nr:EAL domain-containing protein [Thiohalobacter thiocyanaticus]BAZ95258.1 multisensor diguanylate cyclase/phophodiesterase [Thiohalobacter thiocyanaticus]